MPVEFLSDEQVADFESGDPERVHAALSQQLTPNANPEGGPSRISIKALKPDAGVLTRIAEAKLRDALNELRILQADTGTGG